MIFVISGIIRIFNYYHIGYYNRKITRWTNNFTIKFFTNSFISMNYFALPISIFFLENEENNIFYNNHYIFFYLIKSIIWVFFVALLYFEYRRKLSQTWFGLRGLWLFNGIEQLIKIIFIYIEFHQENSNPLKTLVFIQSCLSMILMYYSFFGSVDYEQKPIKSNTKEVTNTSNNRASNSLQNNSFKTKIESKSYFNFRKLL